MIVSTDSTLKLTEGSRSGQRGASPRLSYRPPSVRVTRSTRRAASRLSNGSSSSRGQGRLSVPAESFRCLCSCRAILREPFRPLVSQACARCRARPSSPTHAAPVQCSRSCPQSRPALPNATYVHARDPKPSAPRGLAPQARTYSLSCSSWLHLLKSWSLRQTRGGSSCLQSAYREKCSPLLVLTI
jgi:hypothetical protein